jgi:hypothetical protein
MSIQRTAQGKMIDMATLAAKNEKVRAVGNMNVNARGDVLDNNNNVVNNNSNRVKAQYRNTIATAKPASQAPDTIAPVQQAKPTIEPDEPVELSNEEQELFDNDEDVQK